MPDQWEQLFKELRRLNRRALDQKSVWNAVAGMIFRRISGEWFNRAGALGSPGGGPSYNPWRALKSASYIRRKRRKGKDRKLVWSGVLRQSYWYEAGNDHATIGNRDTRKAGWLENMGFEIAGLEDDIKERGTRLLTEFIWRR